MQRVIIHSSCIYRLESASMSATGRLYVKLAYKHELTITVLVRVCGIYGGTAIRRQVAPPADNEA